MKSARKIKAAKAAKHKAKKTATRKAKAGKGTFINPSRTVKPL
jgi:hypothetical protein